MVEWPRPSPPLPLFTQVRGIGILRTSRSRSSRKYAWPRCSADNTHGRIVSSPEACSPERGYGCRRIWHVPRANADKPPNAVPQAEAACRGVPKRSLTARRRAPGAPTPQEDDPGRCQAQLDPLGALPAFLPARILADLWVEPDAGAFWLEHPFVGRVILRVVQRRSRRAAIDGVARAKRLHRRGARPQGAGDPLVAPVLLHPTADVICELRERYPLIFSHARNHLPILGVAGCATGSTRPKRCPTAGRASVPLPSFPSNA